MYPNFFLTTKPTGTSGPTLPILRVDLDERKLETEQKYQHHLKKTVEIIIVTLLESQMYP